MSIPKRVKIGHIPYRIVVDKDVMAHAMNHAGVGLAGQSSSFNQKILLHPDQGPDAMADTLLHEILHQALDVSGCKMDDEDEERFVRAATGPLLGVLRTQPTVVAFLMGRD